MSSRAYGYIRVSTEEQELSLEAQRSKIDAYCALKGLHLVDVYVDVGVSARKVPMSDRPSGGALLKLLGRGQGIVVVKFDRLFRSLVDGLATIESWNRKDIAVHLADQDGVSLDTSTAMGWAFVVSMLTWGELEAKLTGERTARVLRHKREQGQRFCGIAPYGYSWGEEGSMEECHEEQETIRVVCDQQEAGERWIDIAKALNGMGRRTRKGKVWTGNAVLKLHGRLRKGD